ncbi:MAG TPA: phosphatidylglycerol lysyltransferase domain-containing protein [Gaiellaceae bacterium]
MRRAAAAGRAVLATLGGLAVLASATGWLYVLRAPRSLPGPRVGDALPLDELARRSAVPLLLFVLVWAAAGLLLGLLARLVRLEQLTSALVLTACTGAWCYLVTATSILIVRQVPADAAFDSASRLRAVYLPAALAGLAGAVTGRRAGTARPWTPALLGAAVAAAGVLGVLEGILPHHDRALVDALAPAGVHPIMRSLVAPAGLALVLAARGLARRKRRAWRLAVGVLATSSLLQLLHGFTLGAAVAALLALTLVARRHVFSAQGDPATDTRVLVQTVGVLAAIFAYGIAALWVNRLMADQPFTLGFALRETGRALVGLNLRGSAHLVGEVGAWFPKSVFLAGCVGAAWLIASWLGPWRYRLRQEAHEHEVARALVAAWGVDTLAPFVLRADKSYFFDEDERAFLAYKVVGGVAVVSGDPVGAPADCDRVVERFLEFAHARDWRVAVLGASEAWLPRYRSCGLHALYHGDEAVLEVDRFSLEGRAIRKVRQSVHRLEREGYTAKALHPRELTPALRRELEAVAREWRGREPERGFVMAFDTLFRLEDDEALFVVGFGPGGAAAGFLHFAVSKPGCALSLSSMPRLRSTPNGFNEWLVCAAVDWARTHGFARISLNFAPFAALLAPEAELSALQRVERRALLSLKGHFQLDNLLLFSRKFAPSWQRRFVVYERRRDLPRVGIAALAAEAYLPFAGRRGE